MKTRTTLTAFILGIVVVLMGCSSNSQSTPFKELANTYAKIATNNQELFEVIKAANEAADRSQLEKYEKDVARIRSEKEELGEKAKTIAEKLLGASFDCEATSSLGIHVTGASITTAQADAAMARIVIQAEYEGTPNEKPYACLMAGDEVVYTQPLLERSDKNVLDIILLFTTSKGAEYLPWLNKLERATAVRIATQQEAKTGQFSQVADTAPVSEQTGAEEPEPLYEGIDETNSLAQASVDGVKIEKGANLVDVLRAVKNVTYDYNLDSGIWVNIGDVAICIDFDQLTQKGTDYVNAFSSDMASDIKFSLEYIKPDATINYIEQH